MTRSPSATTPEGRKGLDERIREYFYNSEEELEIDKEVRPLHAELETKFERLRH